MMNAMDTKSEITIIDSKQVEVKQVTQQNYNLDEAQINDLPPLEKLEYQINSEFYHLIHKLSYSREPTVGLFNDVSERLIDLWWSNAEYGAVHIEQIKSRPSIENEYFNITYEMIENQNNELNQQIIDLIETLKNKITTFLNLVFDGYKRSDLRVIGRKHDKIHANTFFKLLKTITSHINRWNKHFEFVRFSPTHSEFFEDLKITFERISYRTKLFEKQKGVSKKYMINELHALEDVHEIFETSTLFDKNITIKSTDFLKESSITKNEANQTSNHVDVDPNIKFDLYME